MHTKRSWVTIVGLTLLTAVTGCESQMIGSGNVSLASTTALTAAQTKQYGPYLADQAGRSLYLLEGEPKNESTCHDQCAEAWPPLLASDGLPEAGDSVIREDLIGSIRRQDGTRQVTYNGHSLYYYVKDRAPGQTSGQDFTDRWGEWYLVTPAGHPLEEEHSDDS